MFHVQKFEISPHDSFFLHGHRPCVRDKYQVWTQNHLELALVLASLLVQLDDGVLLQILVQLHCSCQALLESKQTKEIHEGIKINQGDHGPRLKKIEYLGRVCAKTNTPG